MSPDPKPVYFCVRPKQEHTQIGSGIWTAWARSFSWWHVGRYRSGGGIPCTELVLSPDVSVKLSGMHREENLTQEKCRDLSPGSKPSFFQRERLCIHILICTNSSCEVTKDQILAKCTGKKDQKKRVTGLTVFMVRIKIPSYLPNNAKKISAKEEINIWVCMWLWFSTLPSHMTRNLFLKQHSLKSLITKKQPAW